MSLHCICDLAPVAAAERDRTGKRTGAAFRKYHRVAPIETLDRERKPAQAVSPVRIDSRLIKEHIGPEGFERELKICGKLYEVLFVSRSIREPHVYCALLFYERVVLLSVKRKREYFRVGGKDCGRAVALMNVAIYDRSTPYRSLGPEHAYRNGYVVEHTEALSMIAEGVMGAAAEICSCAVLQGRTRRSERARDR